MAQNRLHLRHFSAVATLIAAFGWSLSIGGAAADERVACGRWNSDLGANHDNAPTFNGPCANTHNLEQMIQVKSDLRQGRPLGPANAEREAAAVKRYEEGKVKTESDYKSSSAVSMFGYSASSGGQ
jgi:hypothetical protein